MPVDDTVVSDSNGQCGRIAPLLAPAATALATRLVVESALGCDVASSATQTASGYGRHRSPVSSDALNTVQAVLRRPSVFPDHITMAVLVEELVAALGIPGGDGLRLELLMTVASATQRAIPAYPGARYNPENSYPPFTLTQALRHTAGHSAEGVLSLEEARRLARLGLSGLGAPLGVSLDCVRDVLTPGRELQLEDDADAKDPLLGMLDDLFHQLPRRASARHRRTWLTSGAKAVAAGSSLGPTATTSGPEVYTKVFPPDRQEPS